MKNAIARVPLAAALALVASGTVLAQTPPLPSRTLPQAVPPGKPAAQPSKSDPAVSRTGFKPQDTSPAAAAAPAPDGAVGPPAIALPTEPIEPYLLTTAQGPFMILAHTFRGPYAAKYAQSLAMELRQAHNLPAYVFFMRIQPGGSNIRNIPPTAPDYVKAGEITPPESYRSYDEAAVLVGNYPTIADAEKGLKQVKNIKSTSIDGTTSLWTIGDTRAKSRGLKSAIVTANPLVAAQRLYPGNKDMALKPGAKFDPFLMASALSAPKVDPKVKQWNVGPNSLLKNPGEFTLVVAEFGGRSTYNAKDPRFLGDKNLKNSPLQTAFDDAEALVQVLSNSEEIKKAGVKVYVYHDRSNSRVCVGSFQQENDPGAEPVRKLIAESIELFKSNDGEVVQARLNQDPSTLKKFQKGNGSFYHLSPSPTLMRVPRG